MTCFIPQTHKITGRMKIVLWLQSTASQRRPRQREWDTGTPRALPLCLGSCDTLSVQSGVSSVSSPILLYKITHISKEIQMMFPMPPAFLYTALQLGKPKHMSDHLGIRNRDKQHKTNQEMSQHQGNTKMPLSCFKCANFSLEKSVIFEKGPVLLEEEALPCWGRRNHLSATCL